MLKYIFYVYVLYLSIYVSDKYLLLLSKFVLKFFVLSNSSIRKTCLLQILFKVIHLVIFFFFFTTVVIG